MNMMREARAAERIPIKNQVNVLVKGRVVLAALAVNISLGGLSLNAAAPLPLGSPCEVAIYLPAGHGSELLVTQGTVVRSGAQGTAIQFAGVLGDQALASLASRPAPAADGSILQAYRTYFKVSQSKVEGECERIYGVSRRTFHAVSTLSFLTCIPTALLPIWLLRAHIPEAPNAVKVVASFAYGAFWLLALQPLIDLALFRILRKGRLGRGSGS